jgi:hypothetical protein
MEGHVEYSTRLPRLLTNTSYGPISGKVLISASHIAYMSRLAHGPGFRVLYASHWLDPASFLHFPPNDNFSRDAAGSLVCFSSSPDKLGIQSSISKRLQYETLNMTRRILSKHTQETTYPVAGCVASAVMKESVDAPGLSERENYSRGLTPPNIPRHSRVKVRPVCIWERNQHCAAASGSAARRWHPC